MSTTPQPHLFGRSHERAVLDHLLTGLRAGRAGVCVIRGEAGIGKSALLDYLAVQASGMMVTRGLGVQADMELAYAALHQLCLPFIPDIDHLPDPQREALSVAFGLRSGQPPDRFLVGLAVLSLWSHAAESQPVAVLVDDAQWLDSVSRQTLEFVARRLLAEPVAMIFAVRDPEGSTLLTSFHQLLVDGLDPAAAGSLLATVIEGHLDEQVRDRIITETGGSPLALQELPRGRSVGELSYGVLTASTGSVATQIEQGYARRLEALPAPTRKLLLIAAADPVGDARLVMRAADRLDIALETGPAKAAGLIAFGESLRFRHPLARSAIYQAASPDQRRAAHAALAAVTSPVHDPDRRAWHTAQACAGPDEDAAAGLEQAAGRARQRGGMSAEAVLLEHAAALTPDPARRGRRALAAAEAHFSAATPDQASEMATLASLCPLSPIDQARLSRLRARLLFALRRSDEAAPLLLEAADQFAAHDAALARETYLEAISATVFAGRVHGPAGAKAAATAALSADLPAPSSGPAEHLLDGVAVLLTSGPHRGIPLLRRELAEFADEPLRDREATMRWLLLAPVVQETFVHQLWDFTAWEQLSARAVHLARETGALGALALALMYAAGVDLHHGDTRGATHRIEEAQWISQATGYAPLTYALLAVAAWRGLEDQTTDVLHQARASAQQGEVSLYTVSGYALGVLYNGLARYDLALAGTREALEHDGYNFTGWLLAEHVEAAVRCGELQEARTSVARLHGKTDAARTDWAQGVQLRCEAMLGDDEEAGTLYERALEHLSRARVDIHVARTHLLYGEWLRRTGRRALARDHLRRAHTMCEEMGLSGFAERARRELVATGEHVQSRRERVDQRLTPQETQIATLASSGMTNRAIGAQLFLSAHTVEWHLRKVYTKLGIHSRRELPGILRSE